MKLSDRIEIWNQSKEDYYTRFQFDPYLIAEIGVNHETKISLAKELCLNAKKSGANAAKFQTYKADLLASNDAESYWDLEENSMTNQKELFRKYDSFEKEDYIELKNYCDEIDLEFMSTPFDTECLSWLSDLVDYFKISSSDITNKILIQEVAKYEKPIIFSKGASSKDEIDNVIDWVRQFSNNAIIINHCVLNYPLSEENANLNQILELKKEYEDFLIGYSDHTKSSKNLETLILASVLGALILEKHFTYDKNQKGNDHFHSMDSKDINNFRDSMGRLKKLGGNREIRFLPSEEQSRLNARRSLCLTTDLLKGDIIKRDHLIPLRPGTGIPPFLINDVIGKVLTKNKKKNSVLFIEDLAGN